MILTDVLYRTVFQLSRSILSNYRF